MYDLIIIALLLIIVIYIYVLDKSITDYVSELKRDSYLKQIADRNYIDDVAKELTWEIQNAKNEITWEIEKSKKEINSEVSKNSDVDIKKMLEEQIAKLAFTPLHIENKR